ncbi:hypothetical protein SLA2020_410120 [Shorea laevis]
MGVVIESSVWEPIPSVYIFIFIFLSCFFSLSLFPYYLSKHAPLKSPSIFNHANSTSSFLRFQPIFLFLYFLAAVMEGVWSVYREFELAYHGVSKQETLAYLCIGFGASLLLCSFLGVLSDLMDQKKFCLVFCILHLFVGILKRTTASPRVRMANICLSLATALFSFSFETWEVAEHEKLGHRQDSLNENSVIFLATIGIVCVFSIWKGTSKTPPFKAYKTSYDYSYILGDNRVLLLAFAQACLQFSVVVFCILWAPTLVADGQEVYLGLICPCLLAAKMLGSTVFPWLISASFQTEDWLVFAFLVLVLVLSIIAYDYQEIRVLVTLFSLFHSCVGMILRSLAHLRTMNIKDCSVEDF